MRLAFAPMAGRHGPRVDHVSSIFNDCLDVLHELSRKDALSLECLMHGLLSEDGLISSGCYQCMLEGMVPVKRNSWSMVGVE